MVQHHLIWALAVALLIASSHQAIPMSQIFATFPELTPQGYRIEDIRNLQQNAQDALMEQVQHFKLLDFQWVYFDPLDYFGISLS